MPRSILFVVFAIGSAAHAQELPATRSCLDTLSPDAFTRVPVLLEATADSSQRSILPAADILLMLVNERMRAALGGSDARLPAGDSVHNWRRLGKGLTITAHANGQFEWARKRTGSDTVPSPADEMLERAITSLRQAGELLPWSDTARTAPMTFTLSFRAPTVRPDRTIVPIVSRHAAAVFTILVP